MKSRYDPREDRILLVLGPTGGTQARFWVARRLWLALYAQVSALAPGGGEDEVAPVPPKRPQPIAQEETAEAGLLETVRINRSEKGTVLRFQSSGNELALTFGNEGLRKFKQMLESQADRAGWDTHAALERLRAEAMAGAAVRRASD